MAQQKPGFFTKRRVRTRRLGKKPGFFVGVGKSCMAPQKPGFFTKRRVRTRRLGKKPGFFVGVGKS